MIFNFWRKYPRFQPKKAGWYQCTVAIDEDHKHLCVMDLFFNSHSNTWIDSRRQNVFDGYQVFKCCRAPIAENHVCTDKLCDQTMAVVAWRKLPKPCGCWSRK